MLFPCPAPMPYTPTHTHTHPHTHTGLVPHHMLSWLIVGSRRSHHGQALGITLYPNTMDAGLTGMVINCASATFLLLHNHHRSAGHFDCPSLRSAADAIQATGTMENFIQNFTGKSTADSLRFATVGCGLTHDCGLVHIAAELELKMNALERIKFYTTAIKTEKPYDASHAVQRAIEQRKPVEELADPGSAWPSTGRLAPLAWPRTAAKPVVRVVG